MTTHNQENASTDDALVASAARIALKSLDSSLLPASSD